MNFSWSALLLPILPWQRDSRVPPQRRRLVRLGNEFPAGPPPPAVVAALAAVVPLSHLAGLAPSYLSSRDSRTFYLESAVDLPWRLSHDGRCCSGAGGGIVAACPLSETIFKRKVEVNNNPPVCTPTFHHMRYGMVPYHMVPYHDSFTDNNFFLTFIKTYASSLPYHHTG